MIYLSDLRRNRWFGVSRPLYIPPVTCPLFISMPMYAFLSCIYTYQVDTHTKTFFHLWFFSFLALVLPVIECFFFCCDGGSFWHFFSPNIVKNMFWRFSCIENRIRQLWALLLPIGRCSTLQDAWRVIATVSFSFYNGRQPSHFLFFIFVTIVATVTYFSFCMGGRPLHYFSFFITVVDPYNFFYFFLFSTF